MLFNLCTAESKEKIGDVFLDETPEVGCNIHWAGETYRVAEIAWTGTTNSNKLSSGLLVVELSGS